ncbi:hypothetical protein ASV10_24375 [Enterobacter hormaechei subsp. xiangfangensis]|nr:hypothetical protein ASV10_24375 [Enterobacter hormaechei subsp. xiangfangensis]KTJ09015.1 hypothetical protein ASU90_24120 [Enterobacter hormaechei subsp. xiangfangensis]
MNEPDERFFRLCREFPRTCIASMGRFQLEFEPLSKAQAERIAEEIETADHLKKLRAQRAA